MHIRLHKEPEAIYIIVIVGGGGAHAVIGEYGDILMLMMRRMMRSIKGCSS